MTFKKSLSIMILAAFSVGLFALNPILKSLILPGWGEISLGSKTGYLFMTTEVGLISSSFYYNNEADNLRKEAYLLALKYGHLEPGSYSETELHLLTKFNHSGNESGGYNANIYQNALNQSAMPVEDYYNLYKTNLFWNWDSTYYRHKYRGLRGDALQNDDIAKTLSGALIANRLISVINVFRIQKKHKTINFSFKMNNNFTPMLNYSFNF